MGELYARRSQTEARVKKLREKLGQAEKLLADKACVYATGSFGRNEASEHSDLDLFIAKSDDAAPDGGYLQAALVRLGRAISVAGFAGSRNPFASTPDQCSATKISQPNLLGPGK